MQAAVAVSFGLFSKNCTSVSAVTSAAPLSGPVVYPVNVMGKAYLQHQAGNRDCGDRMCEAAVNLSTAPRKTTPFPLGACARPAGPIDACWQRHMPCTRAAAAAAAAVPQHGAFARCQAVIILAVLQPDVCCLNVHHHHHHHPPPGACGATICTSAVPYSLACNVTARASQAALTAAWRSCLVPSRSNPCCPAA